MQETALIKDDIVDNNSNASGYKWTKFYLGLIYILVVSIFINTFELVFFVLLICPKETEILKEFIDSLDFFPEMTLPTMPPIPQIFNESIPVPTESIGPDNYFNVMILRENQLIDMYNLHLVIYIVIEICIMIIFLLFVYRRVSFRESIGTLMLSLKTVLALCFFQVNLYFFALEFLYTTQDEITFLIYKKLKEDLSD